MIDTLPLRLLQAISRLGSFSAAGREFGYTQPAVTYQMRNLERSVGAELTVRRGRETRLTAAGEELLVHAEHILAVVRSAEVAMTTFAGGRRGVVRVASFPSCYATVTTEAVAGLRASNPAVQVRLRQAEPEEALGLARSGDVDLAIVYRFSESAEPRRSAEARRGLHSIPLLQDQISVILPPDHASAQRSTVSLADLAEDEFLVGTSWFGRMLEAAAERLGFTPRTTLVADDFVAMQAMVAHGMGVACISGLGLSAHRNPRVVARPLAGWPDRIVEIEMWSDLLRLPYISDFVDALHAAVALVETDRDALVVGVR